MRMLFYNKHVGLFLVFFAILIQGYSIDDRTGSLKGRVSRSDNRSAAYISIHIKGTSKATTTDENGLFEFKKLNTTNCEGIS